MKVKIVVKTGQREQGIEKGDGYLIVRVKSRPVKNRANMELLKLLSSYFGKKVKIVSGRGSKTKLVEIED